MISFSNHPYFSASIITKSPRLPSSIEPLKFSTPSENAALIVLAIKASLKRKIYQQY